MFISIEFIYFLITKIEKLELSEFKHLSYKLKFSDVTLLPVKKECLIKYPKSSIIKILAEKKKFGYRAKNTVFISL